jgi:hypothetical protein
MRFIDPAPDDTDATPLAHLYVEIDEAPDPVALEYTGHDSSNAGDEEPSA